MMKIKTSELQGPALRWVVAKILTDAGTHSFSWEGHEPHVPVYDRNYGGYMPYLPDEIWDHGGPIIEREHITVEAPTCESDWVAHIGMHYEHEWISPLTAAMQCFISSNLGDEVDVPEELA
jgi:hypothetical protein